MVDFIIRNFFNLLVRNLILNSLEVNGSLSEDNYVNSTTSITTIITTSIITTIVQSSISNQTSSSSKVTSTLGFTLLLLFGTLIILNVIRRRKNL